MVKIIMEIAIWATAALIWVVFAYFAAWFVGIVKTEE